jgi:hypothetical protein
MHAGQWRAQAVSDPGEPLIAMVLSRSSGSRLRRWAMRAIGAFLVVYMLGAFGIPTFIPYVAVVLAVMVDGVRSWLQTRSTRPRRIPRTDRGETIH